MTSTLHIELRVGQSMRIGDAILTLTEKSGQRARIKVQAPRDVAIARPNNNPSAHECAPSPDQGKEHTHGKHAL